MYFLYYTAFPDEIKRYMSKNYNLTPFWEKDFLFNELLCDINFKKIIKIKQMKNLKDEVKDYNDYISQLESSYVILDNSKRRATIERGILDIAKREQYQLKDYDDLLDIVTNLVEYPYPILASFDKSFLPALNLTLDLGIIILAVAHILTSSTAFILFLLPKGVPFEGTKVLIGTLSG